MRKIFAGFACSLDGYIEGTHGEIDWILIDKEIDFIEEMKRFDSFLYGRKSYESAIKIGGSPSANADHYVISNTLPSVASGYNLIKGNIADQIYCMKQKQGKDIAIFGGANLLSSLLDHNLVDEISVSFIPVLLGQGKPMVDVLKTYIKLSLIKSRTFGNGTIQISYSVHHNKG